MGYTINTKFLTWAELKLFKILYDRYGLRVVVSPKVRLADIINTETETDAFDDDFKKIAMKHIDFCLIDPSNGMVVACIELDDSYHDKELNKKSDAFKNKVLAECGMPLIRIRTAINEISDADFEPIDTVLRKYFTPRCPVCGARMVYRVSQSTWSNGHKFYGCTRYPKCKGSIDID